MKNKKNKKFWQFKASTDDSSVGELMLYGDISSYESWWGDVVTPKQFKEDLDALGDITELNIFINSSGGDVFAGQAIRSMLKRHKAYKTGYVDGLAASIASVILTACDNVVMPINAMQMVHKCWTFAIGNADDMRKMAEDMDKIDESIIAAYQEKTGLDKEKIIEMMTAETWMTAEEAVELGFADEIEEAKKVAASMNEKFLMMNGQRFELSRFKNPPEIASVPVVAVAPVVNPVVAIVNTPTVQGQGRTLSAENEQRITDARDLLNEVLGQLDTTDQAGNSAGIPPASAAAALIPPGSDPPQPTGGQQGPPDNPEPTALAGGPDPPGTAAPPDNLKILKAKLALKAKSLELVLI
ncbi:MAG: head maturation protease, ClpP-related [Desulfosporosinus sp.]